MKQREKRLSNIYATIKEIEKLENEINQYPSYEETKKYIEAKREDLKTISK